MIEAIVGIVLVILAMGYGIVGDEKNANKLSNAAIKKLIKEK